MIVRYRKQALDDIDAIYNYIHERSPVGAQNVMRAIYAGVHLVGARPMAGPGTSDPTVRVKVLTKYRYKIFYAVGDDAVEIPHVRHMSRTPWL